MPDEQEKSQKANEGCFEGRSPPKKNIMRAESSGDTRRREAGRCESVTGGTGGDGSRKSKETATSDGWADLMNFGALGGDGSMRALTPAAAAEFGDNGARGRRLAPASFQAAKAVFNLL